MDIKIKKVDPAKIHWRIKKPSIYEGIYKKLEEIKVGEAIEVEMSEAKASVSTIIVQYLRHSGKTYTIVTKKIDSDGYVWAILKTEKKEKR